jgi:hypothetical protein
MYDAWSRHVNDVLTLVELKFDWANLCLFIVSVLAAHSLLSGFNVQRPQELVCRRCRTVRTIVLSHARYFRNTFI